jgi:hypothetical protein
MFIERPKYVVYLAREAQERRVQIQELMIGIKEIVTEMKLMILLKYYIKVIVAFLNLELLVLAR